MPPSRPPKKRTFAAFTSSQSSSSSSSDDDDSLDAISLRSRLSSSEEEVTLDSTSSPRINTQQSTEPSPFFSTQASSTRALLSAKTTNAHPSDSLADISRRPLNFTKAAVPRVRQSNDTATAATATTAFLDEPVPRKKRSVGSQETQKTSHAGGVKNSNTTAAAAAAAAATRDAVVSNNTANVPQEVVLAKAVPASLEVMDLTADTPPKPAPVVAKSLVTDLTIEATAVAAKKPSSTARGAPKKTSTETSESTSDTSLPSAPQRAARPTNQTATATAMTTSGSNPPAANRKRRNNGPSALESATHEPAVATTDKKSAVAMNKVTKQQAGKKDRKAVVDKVATVDKKSKSNKVKTPAKKKAGSTKATKKVAEQGNPTEKEKPASKAQVEKKMAAATGGKEEAATTDKPSVSSEVPVATASSKSIEKLSSAAATKPTTANTKDTVVPAASVAKENTAPAPSKASPVKKKKKKKKLSFQDQVFQHMMLSYKPFSLKSLAAELKTTESSLNFLMLSLVDKGAVIKKEFTSKSRSKELYWVNYDAKSKEIRSALASPEEMAASKAKHDELQEQADGLNNILQNLLQGPSNEELTEQLQREEAGLQAVQQKIQDAKDRIRQKQQQQAAVPTGRGPPKTAAQLAKERCPRRLKIRINHMRGEWKKRKQRCVDFIDQLADGMEKKPKAIVDMLDIETDEMVGVKLPPKQALDD